MVDAAETALLESVPDALFIGGEWSPAISGATLKVDDPATGKSLTEVEDGSADNAAARWSRCGQGVERTPPRERAEMLRRAFDPIRARADQVALLMTLEMGKPLVEAKGEVLYGNEFLRWFSRRGRPIVGRYGVSPEGTEG